MNDRQRLNLAVLSALSGTNLFDTSTHECPFCKEEFEGRPTYCPHCQKRVIKKGTRDQFIDEVER